MDSQPSQSWGRSSVDSPTTTSPHRTFSSSSTLGKTVSDAGSQSLSSILNNPHVGKSDGSWATWWWSSSAVALPEFSPLVSNKASSELSRSDFHTYLASVSEPYHRFEDIRKHAAVEESKESIGGQGEALVACLREVPASYFKEDYSFSNFSENLGLQEKLSQYLDVVELHLVKEISLRSNSFFEAQGQLQDLNGKIVEGCGRIRELKETIRLLDKDLVESARRIQELNATRSNLLALQHKLGLILNVNQALSTLKLLVASSDCAGALDVTDDLQHLLDGDELTGLHCFRHLRDHVAASIESISSILSTEFLHASIHEAGGRDVIILTNAKARASVSTNGKDDNVKLDDEDASSFQDRLLPLVVGLLRIAKLPAVLRVYRDNLTGDMKNAIKTAVAELLPILVTQPLDSDFNPGERAVDADGGGSSLASKLRSLSTESFVQLLTAIFKIVRAHLMRAAEVKKAIEWIMSNLNGHYAADSVAAAIALGAAAAETLQESDGQSGSPLSSLGQRNSTKVPSSQGKESDLVGSSNISKNFRADVLRENAEAVFAACDAAHGRWAKLLGVRALLHPKLRLQEFLSIYNITQEFISATEKIGGRLGYSIRGTLQSQAKAFVDFQHESRMNKIKAVLDQETWVEVDVPDEFQAIVTSLFSSEALLCGYVDSSESHMKSYNEAVASNDGSVVAQTESERTQQPLARMDSSDMSLHPAMQVKSSSIETSENNKADVSISSAQSNHDHAKERGKSTSQTLFCGGVGYHMVNCGLILLKMLSEYIDMNNSLPALSSEVVHRVVEILKFFNTRTCQLVLGAGAMQVSKIMGTDHLFHNCCVSAVPLHLVHIFIWDPQKYMDQMQWNSIGTAIMEQVSGLKSITSKHLALASQVISFTYAIIPEIRRILFLKVPETRKALLLLEIDRVAQDYKVHRDEIHTKLVQIMRERLLFHLRGLPQIVEGWNRPEDPDSQPSQFARSLTKEVGFLQRVLSRNLHEADVQAIFRQVVLIFHSQISEAFSRLEITTPQAKSRLYRDVKHILGCIRSLPSENSDKSGISHWGKLDEFLTQNFGDEAS